MTVPELRIRRLRLHGGSANQVALKLGVQQALHQVRPRASAVPPHAILVIRRLQSAPAFGLKASAVRRWQLDVQRQIEEMARNALRPGRQYIPPHADCVLFVDEVDLLLCYTRDLLARRSAWYWTNLFPASADPGRPVAEQLVLGWQAYPQAIPPLLVALQPRESERALNALSQRQLSRLVHLLHETFALPRDVLEANTAEADVDPHGVAGRAAVLRGEKERRAALAPAGPAAGRAGFAPWQQWLPAELRGRLAPPAEYLLGLSHALVSRPAEARSPRFAREAKRWLEAHVAQSEPERSPAARREEREQALSRPPGEPAGPQDVAPAGSDTTPVEGFYTKLGGVFYLINLLTTLDLPAALPPLQALTPWELLGALAAALLGQRYGSYQADPLWPALSRLAGLEAGALWGETVPAADRSAVTSICVLYEKHGFEPVPVETQSWTGTPAGAEGPVSANLAWYVAHLHPFLRHILEAMTGETVAAICEQPATVSLSRTHVDVFFSLEQISVPLRRAGLDRTPGWLPEWGYIITIDFE